MTWTRSGAAGIGGSGKSSARGAFGGTRTRTFSTSAAAQDEAQGAALGVPQMNAGLLADIPGGCGALPWAGRDQLSILRQGKARRVDMPRDCLAVENLDGFCRRNVEDEDACVAASANQRPAAGEKEETGAAVVVLRGNALEQTQRLKVPRLGAIPGEREISAIRTIMARRGSTSRL
jgi:hypothetical protein